MMKTTTSKYQAEFNNLRRTIESDDMVSVARKSDDSIDFYDVGSDRDLSYRLKPYDTETLTKIIHDGPELNMTGEQKTAIANRLLNLPHEILLSVKHILLVNSYADLQCLLTELAIDEDNLPEALLRDCNPEDPGAPEHDQLSDEFAGMSWFQESSIIINVRAIKILSQELANELSDMFGAYDKSDDELQIGFWTTLLHELRHTQINSMIYDVPWLENASNEEDDVETWAIEMFETIF